MVFFLGRKVSWANPCNTIQILAIHNIFRLGDSEPKLGERLDLAIQEEAFKHGDLLVSVFVFACLCLPIISSFI